MPYAIANPRELSEEESDLLRYILQREVPHRMAEIASLKVVARCGCGKCPTVLFATSFESAPKLGIFTELANYIGRTAEGISVGIAVLERDGQIAEMEAWSPAGDDIQSWPLLSSLERIE